MGRLTPTLVAAAACAALTAAVAGIRAVQYPFWQDEVATARVITTVGPIAMLRRIVNTELHPPALYAAGWLLNRLGAPPVWIRGISVLAAVALSAVVVVYARRFVPLWGAALVGLVSALGWLFVAHGWELRPYAVFALAAVLFALALQRVVDQPTRRRLALVIAVVAVGVMTHYFFVFTLAGGLIWLTLLHRRRLMLAVGLGLVP